LGYFDEKRKISLTPSFLVLVTRQQIARVLVDLDLGLSSENIELLFETAQELKLQTIFQVKALASHLLVKGENR
jgi:hypothetical protein